MANFKIDLKLSRTEVRLLCIYFLNNKQITEQKWNRDYKLWTDEMRSEAAAWAAQDLITKDLFDAWNEGVDL
jgi:hypothetical protein